MSQLVPFGTSPLAAAWQGFYSTTDPEAVDTLVTRSVYNCGVVLDATATILTMTLEQPGENEEGNPTGIDDANYIPAIVQYGRERCTVGIVVGGTDGDETNTIVMTFGVAFVTDANLTSILVFQCVPAIDEATGNYLPGGNP